MKASGSTLKQPSFPPPSFPTMSTSALLLIALPGPRHICLTIPKEGHFSGVGADLCRQIRALLTKYTLAQITDLLTAVKVEPLEVDKDQAFRVEDLIPFLEGKVVYKDEYATRVKFSYSLDVEAQMFRGWDRSDKRGTPYELTFTQILAGQVMNDMGTSDSTASVEAVVAMFCLLRSDAECAAVRELLKE